MSAIDPAHTPTATPRFWNLPASKRNAIERAAVHEFATRGYENANTHEIAATAGVSVGALFKYFDTKQDLFLHIVRIGASVIEGYVETLMATEGDVMGKIEALLQLILETSRSQREYIQLYHEVTAIGNHEVVHSIALELEGYSSLAFTNLLADGQARGDIRSDIDPGILAFLLDNVFMSLQYAYSCIYFADRLRLYAPEANGDEVIASSLEFLRSALTGVRL